MGGLDEDEDNNIDFHNSDQDRADLAQMGNLL